MTISVFDIFKIGLGPSSSHTVGPMVAARRFAAELDQLGVLDTARGLRVELYGSLGATGRGHGSDRAVLLGLEGADPATIDVDEVDTRIERIRKGSHITLFGKVPCEFNPDRDLVFLPSQTLPEHPNGMCFVAVDGQGKQLLMREYYSIGGGFVTGEDGKLPPDDRPAPPHPFRTGAELLGLCARFGKPVSNIARRNELAWRDGESIDAQLMQLWQVMDECIARGSSRSGQLPGGLGVKRRAAHLARMLRDGTERGGDPLEVLDWVSVFALSVSEENAAGGRVVTAPTNGAAGIIPAVAKYYREFVPGADDDGLIKFLLTAGAIGQIYQQTGSISGAEVGCQGEVGVACSMAAGALAEVLGGAPAQVENAAEIGMEHHLGLTCDPVGGLVQIPCIERNAMGAIKAISAARMALAGSGEHQVSLDRVIRTMVETGHDMKDKYRETSRGGLAVNVVEC